MDPNFINIEAKAAAEKTGEISKEKPAKTRVARVLVLTYLTEEKNQGCERKSQQGKRKTSSKKMPSEINTVILSNFLKEKAERKNNYMGPLVTTI